MGLPAFPFIAAMAGLSSGAVLLWPRSRHRAKGVIFFMLPLALGFWLIHGGVLQLFLGGPVEPSRAVWAFGLWLRILSVISASQLWLEYVPPPVLIRSLFAGRLPASWAFLLASPLLLAGQIRLRAVQVREAQLSRGVPVHGTFFERASSLTALVFPLVLGLLNELPARSAALDMKGFGLFPRRSSLTGKDETTLRHACEPASQKFPGNTAALREAAFFAPGESAPLLEIPEFSVPPGYTAFLEGGNGSGKSTLSSMLSGAVPEHRGGSIAGDVRVLGEDVASRSCLAWSPDVQAVQQNPVLSLSGCTFTVREEVAFGPENLALPQGEIRARVERALDLAGIAHLGDRNPACLSGGEAQKLALASALAMNPRLLILDEAFSRIHPADRHSLASVLRRQALEAGSALVVLEKPGNASSPWSAPAGHFRDGRLLRGPSPVQVRRPASGPSLSCGKNDDQPVLVIDDLSFRWKGETSPLLRSVNAVLCPGDRAALTGPNGAGKSTLMRLCAGLLEPEKGAVMLGGVPVGSMAPGERAARIGFLFQDAERQIFHSTVAGEVLFSLRKSTLSQEERMERMRQALSATGLSGKEEKHPLDLNAAERRMVAVASLSVREGDLMLLDEPTRDFDPEWQTRFEEWMVSRRETIVAVSHDPEFTERLFPAVWSLDRGHLTA
jgi:energy-coupling factor transporter ATP-binding protein EcfA2/energy-coupling factor transporter transmembrane protein EcfT